MKIHHCTSLLAAAFAALTFAACSSDKEETGGGTGGGQTKYFELPYAYGTYYHTYWGENAGDFYLMLSDKDYDDPEAAPYKHRIDIDFLSALATDPRSARPLDGEYTLGSADSDRPGVFIEGFLGTDPNGDIAVLGTFWNQPDEQENTTTPHAIVGGKMSIKTEKGITTIRAEFIDENDSTLRISYSGPLEFENRINDNYNGDSRLTDNYAMKADAPVVSIKRIADQCTAAYDRWDLYFYEKECYQTQGGQGFYIWFELITAPGQEYIPSGTYRATAAPDPGFLPGAREETVPGSGVFRAVKTWFYAGRTPHAPIADGSLTVKTANGTDYEVSFAAGDDHPMPYVVSGSFSGKVRKL